MKKNDVKVGGTYLAKVTDKVVSVRIDAENPHGGWNATNLSTGKKVRIKSAQRLRGPAKGKKAAKADHETPAKQKAEQTGHAPRSELTAEESDKLAKVRKAKKAAADKPKRVSALNAAAEVLKASDKPMRAKEMIEAMAARGLWSSPNGMTPEATLYAAIIREISKAVETGTISRFRKTDRGMFTYNAAAK
jgi:hypothetical protein